MKNNFSFNENIKHVLEDKMLSKESMILQGNTLNKDNYNKTFNAIETDLNTLYEKARTLQDCIRYSDMQLKNEIAQIITECKTTAKVIEEGRDIIKNNAYVKYNIPFSATMNDSFLDRNNTSIMAAKIREGKLSVAENKLSEAIITKAEVKSKYQNNLMENNIDTMLLSKTYRSFYMFNGAISSPIEEVITLKFHEPATINHIGYTLSNCTVKDITFKLADDSIEKVKIDNTGKIKSKTIKEATITIVANNYIVSQLNYTTMEGDFWSNLEEIKIDQNLYLGKDKFYYYLFGIDNLDLGFAKSYKESCFLSQDIQIGSLKDGEHITLEDKSSIERGAIEYYIIDRTNTIPILPEHTKSIVEEKIFYKMPLRFAYDSSKPFVIKRNGTKVSMSIEEAIGTNTEDLLTISYTPIKNNIKIYDEKIKVKAIIREYDSEYNTFIEAIGLKKYGGGTLWIDQV